MGEHQLAVRINRRAQATTVARTSPLSRETRPAKHPKPRRGGGAVGGGTSTCRPNKSPRASHNRRPHTSPLSRETRPAKHPKPRRGGGAGGGGTTTCHHRVTHRPPLRTGLPLAIRPPVSRPPHPSVSRAQCGLAPTIPEGDFYPSPGWPPQVDTLGSRPPESPILKGLSIASARPTRVDPRHHRRRSIDRVGSR